MENERCTVCGFYIDRGEIRAFTPEGDAHNDCVSGEKWKPRFDESEEDAVYD
jgi:hypothetical protein